MTGYLHPSYSESLAEFGKPLPLARCSGHLLARQIPNTDCMDAMGCYPLFCCQDWTRLREDLEELRGRMVSVVLVTNPMGNYDEPLLHRCFDRVVKFKEHFIADLDLPLEQFTSVRHRKYARRAFQTVSVEICSDPQAYLEEWVRLYGYLIERHQITGMRRFSHESFARQLAVPGMVMFRGSAGGETVSLDLWYAQGDVAQAHLVGTSPRGYELQASYAMKQFILEYFTGKVRWANLGAVPGENADGAVGLADFKRGWSSETRTAYLCGKILNPSAYKELVRATQSEGTDFFPAYRKGEFSSPVAVTAD